MGGFGEVVLRDAGMCMHVHAWWREVFAGST